MSGSFKCIPGYATSEATAAFAARHAALWDEGSYRKKQNLTFSSIGIGSYLGNPDEKTDLAYKEALKGAVRGGINVIDSAINYRCQRSERNFGEAIAELIQKGDVKREELIVCTKGGFIPFDGSYPDDPADFIKKEYFQTGLLKPEEVAQGCHAMTPKYLEDQLEKSLSNLGLETIDIYYLHNPETQLDDVDRREFLKRMKDTFEWLEKKVAQGKIRMYGTATWNGFRVDPQASDFLSLQELLVVAREAAGPEHHFRAIQLPINLAMLEGWVFANQPYAANRVALLGFTARMDMVIVGSASLLQARLAGNMPESIACHFKNLETSAQKAIQLARSIPGVTTSLVGMKTLKHVEENLVTAKVPPLKESELFTLLQK